MALVRMLPRISHSERVTGNPEVIGWGAHLKAKEFRLELAHAGFPL